MPMENPYILKYGTSSAPIARSSASLSNPYVAKYGTPSAPPSPKKDSIVRQAIAGAVEEFLPFGLTKRAGEMVEPEAKTTAGKVARVAGGFVGSIPTFLLAGAVTAPLKGLSFFQKLAKLGKLAKTAEEAGKLSPILSKGAQMIAPAAEEALTGAAFSGLQTELTPEGIKEAPKNIAAGAAGFAPFGAAQVPGSKLGKFLTVAGGMGAIEAIKEGRVTPEALGTAGLMGIIGAITPKGKKLTGKTAKPTANLATQPPVPPSTGGEIGIVDKPYTFKYTTDEAAKPGKSIVVNGKTVGGVSIGKDPMGNGDWLYNIELDPKYRNQGIGTKVIQQLQQSGKIIRGTAESPSAISFFKKLGATVDKEGNFTFGGSGGEIGKRALPEAAAVVDDSGEPVEVAVRREIVRLLKSKKDVNAISEEIAKSWTLKKSYVDELIEKVKPNVAQPPVPPSTGGQPKTIDSVLQEITATKPKKIVGRSANVEESLRETLSGAQSQEEAIQRLTSYADAYIPGATLRQLADLRAGVLKEVGTLVGTQGNYKKNYAARVALRNDPDIGPLLTTMESVVSRVDDVISSGQSLGPKQSELVDQMLTMLAKGDTSGAKKAVRDFKGGKAVKVPKTIGMGQQVAPGMGVGEGGPDVGPVMSGPKGSIGPIPKTLSKGQKSIPELDAFIAEMSETATPAQVALLNELRKRAGIRLRELQPAGVASEGNLKKISKAEATKLIQQMQPGAIGEEVLPKVAELRHSVLNDKITHTVDTFKLPFKPESEIIASHGQEAAGFQQIINDVKTAARAISQSPTLKPKKESVLSILIPGVSRPVASDIAGIRDPFFGYVKTLDAISQRYGERLRNLSYKILEPLTEQERKALVFMVQDIPMPKDLAVDVKAPNLIKAVKSMREMMDMHYEFSNWFRSLAGKKPFPKQKNYLPWVLSEQTKEIVGQGGKVKFQNIRTKEMEDFMAGLFEQDPYKMMDSLADSSQQYAKVNMYTGLLKPRMEELGGLGKVSRVADALGKSIEQLDVYGVPSDMGLYMSATAKRIGDAVNRLVPGNRKILQISPELKASLENTHFKDQLDGAFDEMGRIVVPKVDVGGLLLNPFTQLPYLLKLTGNLVFGAINLTQSQMGVSTMGVKNWVKANKQFFSMVLGQDKEKFRNMQKILDEMNVLKGSVFGGEETGIVGKAGSLIRPIGKDGRPLPLGEAAIHHLTAVGRLTEMYNRMVTFLTAENYLNEQVAKGVEKGGVRPLSQYEKDKLATQISIFYNFLSGKFYSPALQRSPFGKALYVFNQYPVNMLDVYSSNARMLFKDSAVKDFWQRIAREGGASQSTIDAFKTLDVDKKTRIAQLATSLVMPVATVLLLTQNWEIAKRAMPWPGNTRFSTNNPQMKLLQAAANYMQDPVKYADDFRKAIEDYFEPVAIQRVIDAVQGGPKTSSGKYKYFIEDKDKLKAAMFGASSTEEGKRYMEQLEAKDAASAGRNPVTNLLYTLGLVSKGELGKAAEQVTGTGIQMPELPGRNAPTPTSTNPYIQRYGK